MQHNPEAQQKLPRQTEQLLSSLPTQSMQERKEGGDAEWVGMVATERQLSGVAGSCGCEAPCHTAAQPGPPYPRLNCGVCGLL